MFIRTYTPIEIMANIITDNNSHGIATSANQEMLLKQIKIAHNLLTRNLGSGVSMCYTGAEENIGTPMYLNCINVNLHHRNFVTKELCTFIDGNFDVGVCHILHLGELVIEENGIYENAENGIEFSNITCQFYHVDSNDIIGNQLFAIKAAGSVPTLSVTFELNISNIELMWFLEISEEFCKEGGKK